MELTDKYEFGKAMFNGAIPVMKNGELSACIRNQDMVVPSEIIGTDEMGGKVIKSPCHKQCMALIEGVATHKQSGDSKKIHIMNCLDTRPALEIKESDIKANNTRSLIL